MWNFFTHFIAFGFGMTMGVVLMCLLQAGKMADEEMAMLLEKKKQEEKGEYNKNLQGKAPAGLGIIVYIFSNFFDRRYSNGDSPNCFLNTAANFP